MKKILPLIVLFFTLIIFASYRLNKVSYENEIFYVASTSDISNGVFSDGVQKFEIKYNCKVEFTDDFTDCDLIYSSGEDFSNCIPLNKYINLNSRRYSRDIIKNSCTQNGNIYGITHALLGNISYCTYDSEQYDNITTPYEYFSKGKWNRNNFINMCKDLNANVSINWNQSYINMRYALSADKDGNEIFDYNTQEQIEWLNFVRTLIYDEGIVNNEEGAFKTGFLPEIAYDAVSSDADQRYIPWPSKSGNMDDTFVDEYHFCVPKTAKNAKASVKLANYMIDSCIETRTNLYRSVMTEEDYKIFEKQLKKTYSYPKHSNYIPPQRFIDDFIHGKTVTEHIFNAENDISHIK